MGEEQKGGRIVRSGLALTLAGTLMVPSTAAFAADGDDQAQQPSATSAVEQAMQQAQANGTDAQGNVTIIVQLEDGGSQGVSLFSRIMGTVKQSRHSYFKDQIRSMVNEEQAQGIALLSAEDADDTSGLLPRHRRLRHQGAGEPAGNHSQPGRREECVHRARL